MKVTKFIVHNTGPIGNDLKSSSIHLDADAVNLYHQKWGMKSSLGYWGGYTFYIDQFGKLTQYRLIGEEGAHTVGSNYDIGICLAGNFSYGVDYPTYQQRLKIKEVMKALEDGQPERAGLKIKHGTEIDIQEIGPHRMFQKGRTCYGLDLSDSWARNLLSEKENIRQLQELYLNLLRKLYSLLLQRNQLRGVGDSCSLTDNRG